MNTILTIEMITLESLRVLTNMLTFTGLVNRQFDPMFGQSGAKVGDVVYARKPPRYTVRKGAGIQPQATVETRVPVKLSELAGVDLPFSSVERTLSLDNYSDRIIKPVLAAVGNQIDYDGLQQYTNVYNVTGTLGTTPSSTTANATYLGAGVILDDSGAPQDDQRFMVVTPNMQASLVNANLALFNPVATISEGFRKGRFGKGVLGFDWYMDQNCPTHTDGTRTGTNASSWTVYAAVSSGTTLVVAGLTENDTINIGDQFIVGTTAANKVYAVNPQSRKSTGSQQGFASASLGTAASNGRASITIAPEVVTSGAFQGVDKALAAAAIITFNAASATTGRVGLAFHRDAFTLCTAPLELPKGVHEAYYAGDDQTGIGVRIVTAYDIRTNEMITRFDVLYGWATLRPELAVRVHSAT